MYCKEESHRTRTNNWNMIYVKGIMVLYSRCRFDIFAEFTLGLFSKKVGFVNGVCEFLCSLSNSSSNRVSGGSSLCER